jgi:HEAT repeat protein
MGEAAFPALEAIIADPKSRSEQVACALIVVRDAKGDRRRFVEPTVQRLADSTSDVRRYAVLALAMIGSDRDTAPVVALLSDEDVSVVYAAAKTLAAIGGRRDVVAMDVWLKTGNHREARGLRKDVKECRDALQKRLDEAAKNARDGG